MCRLFKKQHAKPPVICGAIWSSPGHFDLEHGEGVRDSKMRVARSNP